MGDNVGIIIFSIIYIDHDRSYLSITRSIKFIHDFYMYIYVKYFRQDIEKNYIERMRKHLYNMYIVFNLIH